MFKLLLFYISVLLSLSFSATSGQCQIRNTKEKYYILQKQSRTPKYQQTKILLLDLPQAPIFNLFLCYTYHQLYIAFASCTEHFENYCKG